MNRPTNEFDRQRLKVAARQLVSDCGGLANASGFTRASKSHLSMYQNPRDGQYMPVDVAADLQLASGSVAMTTVLNTFCGDGPCDVEDPRSEVLDLMPSVAKIVHIVKEVTAKESAGGKDITPRERQEYMKARVEHDRELAELDAAMSGGAA